MVKKKKDQEIVLSDLQEKLKKREKEIRIEFTTLTKKEKDILARTVKLMEEVGELSNDILSVLSLQRKVKLSKFNKRNLYAEFADVILSCISLANSMDVDIERAVRDKTKKIIARGKK